VGELSLRVRMRGRVMQEVKRGVVSTSEVACAVGISQEVALHILNDLLDELRVSKTKTLRRGKWANLWCIVGREPRGFYTHGFYTSRPKGIVQLRVGGLTATVRSVDAGGRYVFVTGPPSLVGDWRIDMSACELALGKAARKERA